MPSTFNLRRKITFLIPYKTLDISAKFETIVFKIDVVTDFLLQRTIVGRFKYIFFIYIYRICEKDWAIIDIRDRKIYNKKVFV